MIAADGSCPVAVLGLGYIGCVTAACLAQLGHRVIGVDRDEFKVNCVRDGKAPFFEPGLDEVVAAGVASGRLSATTCLAGALAGAEIALVCVGTPSERNGNLDLGQLRRVAREIAELLPGRTEPLIVAVRSTVFPGTCDEIADLLGHRSLVRVVSNPEFLREGAAVRDFMEPSLIVAGGSDAAAVRSVAALYAGLNTEPCLVSLRTAEMIKYACNAFHAVKIGFANEIGSLCATLNIPGAEVMDTLCHDTKLNVSRAYLTPGFAFGGSCLPKDLRALAFRASRLDLRLPLVEAILPSNDRHRERAIDAVLDLPAGRIGVFGLAFKELTDDLRESPVVALLERLLGKGRDVRVFDPHIEIDRIYGSNQRFILAKIPHIGRLAVASLDDLLQWASHIVIAQKPSPEMSERIFASRLPVLDLVSANQEALAPSFALP